MLTWLCLLTGCWGQNQIVPNSPHLLLGNPSNATTAVSNPDNYLMLKSQYALSYSRRKKLPNWVSWQLQASNLAAPGTSHRQNNFRIDPDLPNDWSATRPQDYTGTRSSTQSTDPDRDKNNPDSDNYFRLIFYTISRGN